MSLAMDFNLGQLENTCIINDTELSGSRIQSTM